MVVIDESGREYCVKVCYELPLSLTTFIYVTDNISKIKLANMRESTLRTCGKNLFL